MHDQLFLVLLMTSFCHSKFSKEDLQSFKRIVDKELKYVLQKKSADDEKQSENDANYLHGNEVSATRLDNCLDVFGSERCRVLKYKVKMDCNTDRLPDLCARTCGFCVDECASNVMIVDAILRIGRENSVDVCSFSYYGCCSDGLTEKQDEHGSNCPACEDNSASLCMGKEGDCDRKDFAGEWMRLNCKRTCRMCADQCDDDPEYVKFCPDWKEANLCTDVAMEDLMRKHCSKTCDFCPSGNEK